MEEANEWKRNKYQQLIEDCQTSGWKTGCMPVKVGCREFDDQSLWQCLSKLGVIGLATKKLVGIVCQEAEKA